jgi:DNA-directed RNA polymerase specialized sigma24 family protein
VEVLGHYSNLVDQGERVSYLLQIEPNGPPEAKIRTHRRVCRRLDPTQVDQLVAGYAEGVPVADLAATFGIDQWTVQKHARRHALPRRSPRLGPVQTEEAARLYLAGQSLAKLSAHFGVATDTVAAALRRAGVTLRPRRGWRY